MVFFFTLSGLPTESSSAWQVYTGRDKHENELLIKHATNRDLWFHVDKYSSAHCYLRVDCETASKNPNWWRSLSPKLLQQLAILTKANSITASKLPSCNVIYTPATNLAKSGDMAIGEVGFKRENGSMIGRIYVQKDASMLKEIESTKTELSTETFIEQTAREQKEFLRAEKRAAIATASTVPIAFSVKNSTDPYAPLNDVKAMQSNREASFDEDDFFSV
jgi:hypothetical protein